MKENNISIEALKQLLENAPCGIGLFDIDTGNMIFLNHLYYGLVGYTKEEYLKNHNRNNYEKIFELDRYVSKDSAEEFRKNGTAFQYEYRIIRKDGNVRWIKMSASTIVVGEEKCTFVAFTDITKEKDAFNQMEFISENMGSSLSLFKVVGEKEELIYANNRFFENGGLNKEDYLLHTNDYNQTVLSKEDHDKMIAFAKESLIDGKTREMTQKLVHPDGKIIWVRRRFAALKQDTPNSFLLVSVATDITENKENEMQVALEQRRFQTVIKELNAAVIEWDIKTGKFYASEAYKNYAISDVDTDDILNNRGPIDIVHPDDRDILKHFFEESNVGKERIEVTLRVKMKDESFRWCRMLGFYYRDETGALTRAVGVLIDVNEEHERSFMLNNLLNELPGGVAIFRLSDRLECQYFSDGFAGITGRTRKEVQYMLEHEELMSEGISLENYYDFISHLRENNVAGRPVSFVYHFRNKDGQMGWLHVSANKIREDRGCPVYYCVYTTPTDELSLYQNIVEDSAIGVFVASRHKRRVLFTNDACRKICGFEHDDVSGVILEDILAKFEKNQLLTKEEVASLSFDEYKEFHVERRGLYLGIKAKALIWNEVDSYILYITDETSEHQNQLRLQKIIDEVPAGIGIFELREQEMTLTYLNKAYCKLIGLNQEQVAHFMEKNCALEGVNQEDHQKIYEMVEKVKKGSDYGDVLLRLIGYGKQWMWFHMSFSVVERNKDYIKGYAVFSNCDDMMNAQEELNRNYLKEQTLMDAIPGGTAIYRVKKNGTSSIEYASEGFCKLTGYTKIELMSQTDISKFVNIEDLEEAAQNVIDAIHNAQPISIMYRVIPKDRNMVLIKMDAKIMTDETLGEDDLAVLYAVHTKISDASLAAMQEQKYYRMILNMTGAAFFEWDTENGFYASKGYDSYQISDGGIEALMGSEFGIHSIHPDDMSLVLCYMREIDGNEVGKTVTVRLKMKDGTYQWTEVICYAKKDENGIPQKLVGIFRDVDKEWIEKNKKLKEALDIAERANSAKTAFLSRVSHDMRTPLNGILGLTSFLKESVVNEQAAEDISQLEVSGKYLLNLINDTLDISRIENGKLELHPVVCNGKEIFENILELAKPGIEAKKQKFLVSANDVDYCMIYCDMGRMEQIVMNIIGNAIKFTSDGGKIECKLEQVYDTEQITMCKMTCIDTGIGMSKEFIPTIFDAFSQASETKENARKGTGLGMAITKQLVDLMGGTIQVESELGKGSTFIVEIPFKKATTEQITTWKKSLEKELDNSIMKGKRVLLCEDHPLNREIAIRLLENKGILVEIAENGSIGVEKFENSEIHYYDFILMDVQMPVMDGLDATRAIRKMTRADASTIPIIAMTGNSFDEDVAKTKDAGMNAHLNKPIDSVKFFETICEQLSEEQN